MTNKTLQDILRSSAMSRVTLALRELGPLTLDEACDAMGCSRRSVYKSMVRLIDIEAVEAKEIISPHNRRQKQYHLRMSVHDGRTVRERANL